MKKSKIIIILPIILIIISLTFNIYFLVKRQNEVQSSVAQSEKKEDEEKPLEIERKWLIDTSKLPFDLQTEGTKMEIEQTYVCFSPEVRIRHLENQFYLTIKANLSTNGLKREEVEYYISEQEYKNLYEKRDTSANVIKKTRYDIVNEEVLYHFDIYHDNLEGLVTVEVEGPKNGECFETEEEALSFNPPEWVGREVTGEVGYKNGTLARKGLPQEN